MILLKDFGVLIKKYFLEISLINDQNKNEISLTELSYYMNDLIDFLNKYSWYTY